MAFILLQPHVKKNSLRKPSDLLLLDKSEQIQTPKATPQQAASAFEKWDKIPLLNK